MAIDPMNDGGHDLNLLRVFEILLEERNVSRAARRMHMSQPALSHALSRLRQALGDELFTRTPRGVAPTARALALAPRVTEALATAREVFAPAEGFDPARAKGTVVLASTELFEQLALPRLVPLLAKRAPGIVLRSVSARGELPKRAMESGECDVAVAGFFGELPEGFYAKKVLSDAFVCIVRDDHPRVGRTMSLETYLELDHLLVSPQGDLSGIVDVALAKRRKKRRVVCAISNFLTPGWVVADSDAVVTLPSRLAEVYTRHLRVRVLPLPLDVPGITIVQVWHARVHDDPLQRFFRASIEEVMAAAPAARPGGRRARS